MIGAEQAGARLVIRHPGSHGGLTAAIVVVTDSEGRWRLPIADATAFRDQAVRLDNALRPGRSAALLHSEAACMATAGIDFPLRPQDESSCFEALLIADTQPANGAELAYLRDDIVAATIGSGAAFAINHGDVVFDDLSLSPATCRSWVPRPSWHRARGTDM
jgi:hypothetical protein